MLAGCTPWPDDTAARYRRLGIWRGEALDTVLTRSAERDRDAIALVHDDRRISFGELDAWVTRLAAGFAHNGVAPGDRVLVQLPNIPEFVAVVFALVRAGAIPVFSLIAHRHTEISHLVRLSGATHYVFPDAHRGYDHRGLATRIKDENSALRTLFVIGEPVDGMTAVADLAGEDTWTPPPADPSDIAFFLLSGGTTALPKLVPRTHDDYLFQVTQAGTLCGLTAKDVYLAVLPIEFNFAWGCPGVVGTLAVGGTVVLADTPNPMACLPLIEREWVSITSLVPSVLTLWLETAEWTTSDLTSLRLVQVGGAKLAPDLAARVMPTLGCDLQQVFGMAEGLLCFNRADDPVEVKVNTQGKPISFADEIRIVDGLEPVPLGEVGELITRGPYTIRGYYRVPEHNARAFTSDGFYRTGDLARLTPRGDLVIEGRIKDVIIRGGDKVNAAEVEDYLLAHPAIAAAAAVGLPDELLGERICAFIVPSGPTPALAELRSAMHARGAADYKLPDEVRVVGELPLTPLGKVDKKALARVEEGVPS
ncbi:(2,3-dihydroxybenzoyl)adenylate synthase [Nocardia sp. NPDC056000]|uniref:(2,3-dihydroxybenzoyl)adenylate synthase n=1 Tax=Nocardia sp. NPDC056000 TaxID=3345674 RepID=UPI0035D79F19